MSAMPHLVGTQLDDVFELERPIIDFTWNSVSLKTCLKLAVLMCVKSKETWGTGTKPIPLNKQV